MIQIAMLTYSQLCEETLACEVVLKKDQQQREDAGAKLFKPEGVSVM